MAGAEILRTLGIGEKIKIPDIRRVNAIHPVRAGTLFFCKTLNCVKYIKLNANSS
jgi:hypothetical protein